MSQNKSFLPLDCSQILITATKKPEYPSLFCEKQSGMIEDQQVLGLRATWSEVLGLCYCLIFYNGTIIMIFFVKLV